MDHIRLYVLSSLFLANTSLAETVIRPTFPGTDIPDLSKPATVIDNGVIYQSHPTTTIRDYDKPAFVKEKNGNGTSTIYETIPATNIPNKMKGGYSVDDSKE